MKNNPRHITNSIEPLPDHFEPDLTRVDARLMQDTDRLAVPPGLAGRVFRASVGRLPVARHRLVATEFHTETGRRLSWRRHSWGRVAFAASVGLAGAVALKMLQTGPVPTPDKIAVVVSPELDTPLFSQEREFIDPLALSLDSEQLLLGFMSDQPNDLSYLTFTLDLTFEGLGSEIAAMLAELNERGM